MDRSSSSSLFYRANKVIPGGVNSPVRAFKSVGGNPVFITRGTGSRIIDVDGNEYIDYVCSWGPLILGHAHPAVVEAIIRAASDGTTFGTATAAEVELAELIVDAVPSIEMVRLVNSGTEALMSAVRLARAFTGREKIIKFEGCYHGHADHLLAKAGSGIATFSLPDSAGVPKEATSNTIVIPYNDISTFIDTITKYGNETACVIVEPVAGNMGVVKPAEGFLHTLRTECDRYGILLIFDEVITGFRVSYGGAQQLYGIIPDITTLGKIIGGGLPVGAYGGRREIMEMMAPLGPVYQAGTLSGNPIAVAAGIATLNQIRNSSFYLELERKAATLEKKLKDAATISDIQLQINRVGSMMTTFFANGEIFDYCTAKTSDISLFAKYFTEMLNRGIYLAPSQFEAYFVSAAHTDEDITKTASAAAEALTMLKTVS